MKIIAGVLSVAALMWVEPASAQKTYSLSVSRHRALPALSEGKSTPFSLAHRRCCRKIPVMTTMTISRAT